MPRQGDIDITYPNKLRYIGIELLEPFQGTKIHHKMKCVKCLHEWTATPISKIHNYKKWGSGGCPNCTKQKDDIRKHQKRLQNLNLLKERGLEVLSDYDGRYVQGIVGESIPVEVTVKNINCGHTFTSTSKNLLTRGIECPICAKQYKTNILNASSEFRSIIWQKTATEWQKYKSTVTKLSRKSYKENKDKINPTNLPQGKAGVEGAYHMDHIVPIRYCFEHNIPEELCAHPENLQMLHWNDNVGSRDKLKNIIPPIFKDWINI